MKRHFHKKCEDFGACWPSCSESSSNSLSFWQWSLHWIHLSWSGGNCSCRPQTTVLLKQFNFSCHALTFFCFLEFSSVIIGNFCGFHGVFQDSWCCTKYDRKYARIERDHLTITCNLLRDSCSPGLSRYVHTWAHRSSNTRGYRIMTASQEELWLNACSYDLKNCISMLVYISFHCKASFPSLQKVCMCVCVSQDILTFYNRFVYILW